MTDKKFKVIQILALQQGTNERGNWQSQEVIIEALDNVQYPDRILLSFRGEKVKMLEGMKDGDTVTAQWSSSVREWANREGRQCFSQMNYCWKIENVSSF